MDQKTNRMISVMRRMRSIDVFSICDEIPESELICLNALCDLEDNNNQAALSELIGLIHMHAAAVSRSLKSMEKKGLIVRNFAPDNHRCVVVSSTPKGRELHKRNHERLQEYWTKVYDKIPETDIDELSRLFNLMMDSMESVITEYKKK